MNRHAGNIPFLTVEKSTIPEAYEEALKKVWEQGLALKTEYDKEGDPPSRDATVAISIENPYGQPRFHRSFADSLGALAEYVMEVVHGAHDYWMRAPGEIEKGAHSEDTHWTYTYHARLFDYRSGGVAIDQVSVLADRLADCFHTRRAQAITWNPLVDAASDEPPCLQRIWARVVETDDGEAFLNLNTHWRSRDLFKAWFENVIALTTLQRKLADSLTDKLRRDVQVGRYFDVSDSLHIYGSYFKEIEGDPAKGIKNFFEQLSSRPFEERTWTSEFVKPFFIDDGTGKGLAPMLEREKNRMPEAVWQNISNELSLLTTEDYIV